MFAALILVAASAPIADASDDMMACVRRESPRIERIEQSLESVARIVVNVVCVEPLRRLANTLNGSPIAGRSTGQVAQGQETIARGYEFRAMQSAIEAREARLGLPPLK